MPEIYRYLDYRAYLSDWFEARKAEDPSFSRRSFARLAGKSSPGLLTEVLNGRQLTAKMVSAFSGALGLSKAEADFFDALVQLDQATNSVQRNHAWKRISAARPFQRARSIEGASVRYLSQWWIPVVKELAHRREFRLDPKWIATRVRPPISEAQARVAIDTLTELELIQTTGDGRARPTDNVVSTPKEVQGLAVHNYHKSMLERGIDAIDTFPPEDRHFLAATVSVPASLMPTLKAELNSFHQRILQICGPYEDNAEQVLQLHMLMFPLSDRDEGEES